MSIVGIENKKKQSRFGTLTLMVLLFWQHVALIQLLSSVVGQSRAQQSCVALPFKLVEIPSDPVWRGMKQRTLGEKHKKCLENLKKILNTEITDRI